MKKLLFIIACSLSLIIANAQAPSASLTLTCPSASVTPGTSFYVNVAYGYSNIAGNIVATVSYNNTLVNFCGSPGFGYAPVSTTSGTTTTLTYTFPSSSGSNQTGAIQMCFSFPCPQTCFGTALSATFSGSIATPTLPAAPSNTCTTSGTVINNWSGSHWVHSYNCITNTVTFRVRFYGSTCYTVNNPKVQITNSIGTLISTTLGTISGSTIILGSPLVATWYYDFYYTIQLPCVTTAPSVLTTTAVLNGDNCGSPVTNILTLPSATFNVPATTPAVAVFTQSTGPTSNSVTFSNTGGTPINLNMTTIIPLVNVTSITNSTSQTSGVTGNLTLYNCSNVAASPVAFNPPTTITVGSLITKANYTINNLLPGQSYTINFNFNKTTSCTGLMPDCHSFTTSGNYTGIIPTPSCNCTPTPLQVFASVTSTYCPVPVIDCYGVSNDQTTCKKAGDLVHICANFMNNGTAALTGGVLIFPIPNYLNYSGGLTLNASTSGVSAAIVGGNLQITLPPSVAAGSGLQTICFDATVNSLAPNGVYSYWFTIQGSNLPVQSLNYPYWCPYTIRICQDPKAEIEKLVKGSEDVVYSSTGSGLAGTIAKYQITVKNTGNTPITNIQVIDRTPQIGDKTMLTCTNRNSQFSMMPNGIFNPVTLSTAATYSSSPTGLNNKPSTWLGLPVCDVTSSFSAPVQNTVLLNIPGTIPPFTNYVFEMQVLVPAGTTVGKFACNTVALKCSYLDNTSASYPLEIIESNEACLTVAPPPPPPCENCKELLSNTSFSFNTSSTTSGPGSYTTQTGVVTFTTTQPVQEIHLSIADLQYHWDKPGCRDCKSPALSRGCLFPQTLTQTIGSLVWNDFSSSNIPAATPETNCPQELIWTLGVMLPPGTYTIPVQLTLPKPTIPNCCNLIMDRFNVKLSLKDDKCNVCDTIIRTVNEDCCTGSYWVKHQMTWSLYQDISVGKQQSISPDIQAKNRSELEKNNNYNKIAVVGDVIVNPVPNYGVLNMECGMTYQLMEGSVRTFSASFACNPALKNCESQTLISISTISGNMITVPPTASPVTQTFSLPGVYIIKFEGKCGGKICNVCIDTIVVNKNCCAGVIKTEPTTITTTNFGFPSSTSSTVVLASPVPGHYTSVGNAIVKLYYNCAQGCKATYSWTRKKNGVVVASGTSPTGNISFAPPVSGEDQIIIRVICGGQECSIVANFFLGCAICQISGGTHVIK